MAHYVFLHGANSSSNSFNYIISQLQLNKKDFTMIDYKSSDGFYFNLENMMNKLSNKNKLFMVGHSLGGIYALHLSKLVDVIGGITIGTPFSGSSLADWARFMIPNYQLFRDVGRNSHPIIMGKKININVPWTQLISTKGRVPWMLADNDGVVTIRSQKSRNDMTHIELPYNHYEIMCAQETPKLIYQEHKKIS
jgi:hypothetical protein